MSEVSRWPRPIALRVVVERSGDVVQIAVSGELDNGTAPVLEQRLDDVRAAGVAEIVLDLRGVTFMGSPGLSIVVQLNAAARRDDLRASVLRGNPRVDRVLE